MTYTSHGHHIPDTTKIVNDSRPLQIVKCGGVGLCSRCDSEAIRYMKLKATKNRQDHVKLILETYYNDRVETDGRKLTVDDMDVVSFTSVMNYWKALLVTKFPDGMLYEVVYDGDEKLTYVDAYVKIDSESFPDPE